MDKIRVLIVDDSAVIRRLLSDLLKEDPQLEVVGMAGNLLALPEDGAGSMSSGGTESILLAVKACRDRARATARLPAGVLPRIVVPGTARASQAASKATSSAPLWP